MKENPLQYRVRGTPVPTTRTRGTNYPESTVHSEILDDEHKDTAAGFWRRASGFFASLGVRVGAVMTDNGACYRSRAFVEALGPGVKHR